MEEIYGNIYDQRVDFSTDKNVPEQGEDDEFEDQPVEPNPLRLPDAGQLEETWWLLGEDEMSELSDRLEKAGDSLEDSFFQKYHIRPVKKDDNEKIFTARFELPQYQRAFVFGEAQLREDAVGWVDFLSGFPMRNLDMLMLVGELASKTERVDAEEDSSGDPIPIILESFPFEGIQDEKKIILNYLYIDEEYCETMAKDLGGEPEPRALHWWCRINLQPTAKYPVPGEFLGMCYRGWPTFPSGVQNSTPYLFSGNWMDTVFYTTARVTSKLQDDPYPKYRVKWRKNYYEAIPTDFAEYKNQEFVTLLKKVPNTKPSQLWKDDDQDRYQTEWRIAPIMFYGLNPRDN